MKVNLISLTALLVLTGSALGAQNVTTPSAARPAIGTSGSETKALPDDYRLVAGDKLRIEVYKDPQISQTLQIRPDGRITLPLVGDVTAAGRTPIALRDAITTSLKEYITNPVVTVIVVEFEPQSVSVMGEVERPGPVPIKGKLSVLEALAVAGGFRDFANTKNITIRRQTSSGVQIIKFNYKDAVKGEGKPVYLQAGDIIIVP
jgi:polysaccharide export outer membrane protein